MKYSQSLQYAAYSIHQGTKNRKIASAIIIHMSKMFAKMWDKDASKIAEVIDGHFRTFCKEGA